MSTELFGTSPFTSTPRPDMARLTPSYASVTTGFPFATRLAASLR